MQTISTRNGPWLITYAHDRRKHKHRCRACNRLLMPGTQAWMARIGPKGTKAIHLDCAFKNEATDGSLNALELLACHAMEFTDPDLRFKTPVEAAGRALVALILGQHGIANPRNAN